MEETNAQEKDFVFDGVLPMSVTQEEVYHAVAKDVVDVSDWSLLFLPFHLLGCSQWNGVEKTSVTGGLRRLYSDCVVWWGNWTGRL